MAISFPGNPHWIVRSQRYSIGKPNQKVGHPSFPGFVQCLSQQQRQVCCGLLIMSLAAVYVEHMLCQNRSKQELWKHPFKVMESKSLQLQHSKVPIPTYKTLQPSQVT